VIGEIVSVHINEQYIKEGRLDRNSLDLIGRMGGMQYTRPPSASNWCDRRWSNASKNFNPHSVW